MKNLFKITFMAAFALVFSQAAVAQASFGAKVGGNLASINYSEDEGDLKSLVSLQVGAIVELPITETIGIRTGVELQGKGAKTEFEELGYKEKTTVNPMYVQIPAVVAYNGSMFFVGAGPFVGFGVGGKVKTKISGTGIDPEEDSETIKFGNDKDFSALDAGARFEAGLKFGKLRVALNYDLGLSNAIPKDVREGESAKNNVLGLSVGYMFN